MKQFACSWSIRIDSDSIQDSVKFLKVRVFDPRSLHLFSFGASSTSHDPANGVPNSPTASSAQIRKASSRTTPKSKILKWKGFIFLSANSIRKPVPDKSTPIRVKSLISQFTSTVNCMAIKGISSKIPTKDWMIISLWFFIWVLLKVLWITK